ncbi:protein kinase [Streptomyces sp. NPDC005279]|uniref:protein kinase n=1 Tax=Streptomyces sp. NPDC005279 TaxID=3364712 RepID=UPI0036BCCCA6
MTGRTVLLGGRPVVLLDPPLGAGLEASVHSVEGADDLVVKVYHQPEAGREHRLRRMLALNPLAGQQVDGGQPPELAWPVDLVYGTDGGFLGYGMGRFADPEHIQLTGLFSREQRLRRFPAEADWRFLLGICWNLAFMTARLHHKGLVIGDFSAKNVVVDQRGFATFLDCDSIGFTDPDTGEAFPSTLHTPDYAAPERLRGGHGSTRSDDFALAVLVYQVLTAGYHPFGGVPRDSEDDVQISDNITASRSFVVRPESVNTPPGTLDPTVLPPALLTLARQAFGTGLGDTALRPTSRQWLEALEKSRAKDATTICPRRPRHAHGAHLTRCPWCDRAEATGHDAFNAPKPTQQQLPPPPPPPPPPQPPQILPHMPSPDPLPAWVKSVLVGAGMVLLFVLRVLIVTGW